LALEFEWDQRKASVNLAKHKVSFEEAATVFGDPLGRMVADPRHSTVEERLVILGTSKEGRLLIVMTWNAPDLPHAQRKKIMKKSPGKRPTPNRVDPDEILPEYDFKRSEPNKFASRYAAGSAVVILEPDVAAAFPNSGEANEALRALAGIIQKHRQRKPTSRRSL
jgi:uncharacterized DUF497 family protein